MQVSRPEPHKNIVRCGVRDRAIIEVAPGQNDTSEVELPIESPGKDSHWLCREDECYATAVPRTPNPQL